jgi:carbamoyl-phosphate synthase large subunit
MEVDVDAISDGKASVMWQELCSTLKKPEFTQGTLLVALPPVSIKPKLIAEIEIQTKKLAIALKVKGFMNIQFAIKNDEIYVIEVNPRASRTVPFVSKAKGSATC